MADATPNVDDYIRQLIACARALPQKNWEWRQFLRPNGEPIETVEHVCEAQNHSASVSDVAELWGVNYGPDTPVVCYTGNGPYSAKHAQYFAAVQPGALIWILDELGERIEAHEDALKQAADALHQLYKNVAEFGTVTDGEFLDDVHAAEQRCRAALVRTTPITTQAASIEQTPISPEQSNQSGKGE